MWKVLCDFENYENENDPYLPSKNDLNVEDEFGVPIGGWDGENEVEVIAQARDLILEMLGMNCLDPKCENGFIKVYSNPDGEASFAYKNIRAIRL